MAKTRKEKSEALKEYQEKIAASGAIYFIEPEGLTADEVLALRKTLAESNATFHYLKNSLFVRALDNKEFTELESGKNAAIFAADETTAPAVAKMVNEFASEYEEKVTIKLGIFENNKITKEEVIRLASLPSRDELLTQLAFVLNAPMQQFASVLSAPARDFVGVLSALSKTKK